VRPSSTWAFYSSCLVYLCIIGLCAMSRNNSFYWNVLVFRFHDNWNGCNDPFLLKQTKLAQRMIRKPDQATQWKAWLSCFWNRLFGLQLPKRWGWFLWSDTWWWFSYCFGIWNATSFWTGMLVFSVCPLLCISFRMGSLMHR